MTAAEVKAQTGAPVPVTETALAVKPVEPQQLPATMDWCVPRTYAEAREMAEDIAASALVPVAYKNKAGDILVAWQYGMPLGLSQLACLQGIAVINGKPSLYGDAMLAVAKASPMHESVQEWIENEDTDADVAVCVAKRRGEPPVRRTFSVEDAKVAGLWGKNTWKQYPKRMLQMRARGFALRDAFPDVLAGMSIAEEMIDITGEVTVQDYKPEQPKLVGTAKLKDTLEKKAKGKAAPPAKDDPEFMAAAEALSATRKELGYSQDAVLAIACEMLKRDVAGPNDMTTAELQDLAQALQMRGEAKQ